MERRPATPEEARALANPLRLRILRLCLDRSLTNEELAARLGRDAGSVLHHVRMLVRTGFLEPDGERRGPRGSVERPYRATGKSWTLDVAEGGHPNLALVDAFRAELDEGPPDGVRSLARMGVRLTPETLATFEARIEALIVDLDAADDPAGERYGFLVGLHRLLEEPPRTP
jgi:DNA-binding transcriptional ArsR family regulator